MLLSTARRTWILLSGRRYATSTRTREGWIFVDSVFPIQFGDWDLRRFIGILREDYLLSTLRSKLSSIKAQNFNILSVDSQRKDGGAFVHFQYEPGGVDDDASLASISEELGNLSGLPTWHGYGSGRAWIVKGRPWREDMHRHATQILKVSFDGPDIPEQSLYELLRPYGRIAEIENPAPVPAGTLRSSLVIFGDARSTSIAKNAVHGMSFPINGTDQTTRLKITYEPHIRAHEIRDWLSKHPRIVFPVILFLLGTLTYTIFDPIRSFMVRSKVLEWFDIRQYKAYEWIRTTAYERFSGDKSSPPASEQMVWKDRKEARDGVQAYLADLPSTVQFIHGPQGSGKSDMIYSILKESPRKYLVIDCRELLSASSDPNCITSLANQVGYWPVFSFLNSMNQMIDLASVGLIGQKAGMSSSLTEQLHSILEVTGNALKSVSFSHRKQIQKEMKWKASTESQKEEEDRRLEYMKRGLWHDGRLDCVAGNGVMSELGIGIERFGDEDELAKTDFEDNVRREMKRMQAGENDRKLKSAADGEMIEALPIVVVRNFATKAGNKREELLDVLAQWAASLAENQVAHVIFISDNRENSKRLAKAIPTKPLNSVALYDADSASALEYVKQKLQDSGVGVSFSREQIADIGRLGGRASDLESLIHKVRSGSRVEDAVEDIIARGVVELRKNAFGDDLEDAKSLNWTREQAWNVIKLLEAKPEIPYHDVLLEFPFKGDESALRDMEHSELISIGTNNGRPSVIRPGKPVFKYVFERLVKDPIFQATQDIAFNEKAISAQEATIKSCEDELLKLKEIGADSAGWFGHSSASSRVGFLYRKLGAAETKIESLEKKNVELKKVIAKGG